MWRWTLKNLVSARLRLVTGIGATAGALLLAILFQAVYSGEAEQVIAYVKNADADVWVMQGGVSNMHMATSYLADWKVTEVQSVPGVASAEPILYLNSVVEAGGKRWFSFIVGLVPDSRRGGPWSMAAGRSQPEDGEVIVPDVFAEMTGITIGDPVRVSDREFTVAGLSAGTFSMGNTVIFMTKADLEDIMTSLDIVSFILVKAERGVEPAVLARRIEDEVDKVSALPRDQFVVNDRGMVMQMGVETIGLMTFIGGVLAVLLVAFTIYFQVAQQKRELAVVKALGVTNRSLYLSVGAQALIISLASVVSAALLAMAFSEMTAALLPQVTLHVTFGAVLKIAVLGIVVALASSLFAARQIAHVDPQSAFAE